MKCRSSKSSVLSKNIKLLRQHHELTLTKMQELTSISKSSISLIEQDKVSPSVSHVEALARGLNLEPWQLLDESLFDKSGKLDDLSYALTMLHAIPFQNRNLLLSKKSTSRSKNRQLKDNNSDRMEQLKEVLDQSNSIPVNIDEICRSFNISISDYSPDNQNTLGELQFSEEYENTSILVNADTSVFQKRFIIANLLATYILNDQIIPLPTVKLLSLYRIPFLDIGENQSINQLALDILVPLHSLEKSLDSENICIDQLSHLFHAPEIAICMRLALPRLLV